MGSTPIIHPMKLGICYMVFDGEELLEFSINAIRKSVDFIAATYQTTSYFGNPNDIDIKSVMEDFQKRGLIDQLIYFEPDFSLSPKANELRLRNIGLEASRQAACTYHASLDVDEFFEADSIEFAKKSLDGYDCSLVSYETYYKSPTFLVVPRLNVINTFIHPVDNEYDIDVNFPYYVETTRKLKKFNKCKLFDVNDIVMHHMSYVRKDLLKKFHNSSNGRHYQLVKFLKIYDTYKVGERVCLLPDYKNRRTVLVDNKFGIYL